MPLWTDTLYTASKIHFSMLSSNHFKHTAYAMHHQFNIQQLYALPTLYLCVLCL
jgi:hypothetical protein